MTTRTNLGERLLQWHSSMGDPVYAVGSYYVSDMVYPKKEMVEAVIENMYEDIAEYQKMLKGEKVSRYNSHYGCMVDDLRAFAGYTNRELRKNISDLEDIIAGLKQFHAKDYK